MQRRPDRFGFFATLALPDVDAALTEVGRAFDDRNICLDITSPDLRATNTDVVDAKITVSLKKPNVS